MSNRSCTVAINFGDLTVEVEADGLYSPDGIHDLVGQVIRGFNEALAYIKAHDFAVYRNEDTEDTDEE
jgi:hypothetical protein